MSNCISIVRIGPLISLSSSDAIQQQSLHQRRDDEKNCSDGDSVDTYICTAHELRNAIVEYFSSANSVSKRQQQEHQEKRDNEKEAVGDSVEDNINSNQIVITNRYFSAPVQFFGIDDLSHSSSINRVSPSNESGSTISYIDDGLILVFNDDREDYSTSTSSSFCATMDRIHHQITNTMSSSYTAGELLRVCVSIGATKCSNMMHDKSSKVYEMEYSKRVLWCLDYGYEYIEINNLLYPSGLYSGHDVRDKDGFPRLIEAISGTVWTSATMFPKQQKQLQQSFVETRSTIQQQQQQQQPASSSSHFDDTNALEAATSDHVNLYISPDPLNETNILQIGGSADDNDRDDMERERKAQEVLLKECIPPDDVVSDISAPKPTTSSASNTNTNSHIDEKLNDREQERIFQSLESTINEARTVREMSISNQFTSDDERRNRAANIAMQLLNVMNLGDDDDDENDNEDDSDNE